MENILDCHRKQEESTIHKSLDFSSGNQYLFEWIISLEIWRCFSTGTRQI